MNRKKRLGGLVVLGVFCLALSYQAAGFSGRAEQAEQQKTATAAPSPKQLGMVYKTYTLKHIKPEALLHAAKMFFTDATSYANSVTVLIYEGNIPRFEELLSKMDVEKKIIQFQIFAVVASRGREEQKTSKARENFPVNAPAQTGASSPTDSRAGTSDKKEYKGELIGLKFREADLRDVVLYIADFARLNVIFDVNVRGTVTCSLKDIPWDQALDIVLSENRMGKTIEGKILRVAPLYVFSREHNPDEGDVIENKELRKVLDELKALWNFTTYAVDGPTSLTARENSGANNVKLVSNRPLNVVIANPEIVGGEPGKRTISIEQVMLTGPSLTSSDIVYLNTHDITLKEKGYLVAGVSGYESSKTALILVISAEIK
jgi:type II secretory pathway component GspD/PulD (secretin)